MRSSAFWREVRTACEGLTELVWEQLSPPVAEQDQRWLSRIRRWIDARLHREFWSGIR